MFEESDIFYHTSTICILEGYKYAPPQSSTQISRDKNASDITVFIFYHWNYQLLFAKNRKRDKISSYKNINILAYRKNSNLLPLFPPVMLQVQLVSVLKWVHYILFALCDESHRMICMIYMLLTAVPWCLVFFLIWYNPKYHPSSVFSLI